MVVAETIHTLEPGGAEARAFAVRDGRFCYVGSRAGALALRGPKTEVLDAGRHVVMPGLIDPHVHLTAVGAALHEVALAGASSFDEVVRRTIGFAATTDDAWIVGSGWDQSRWPGAAFPVHDALSAALPERPVMLRRVDGHAVLVNAKAMALAGITPATEAPPGGRILHDDAGNPTGVFIDSAIDPIVRVVPPPSHAQLVRFTHAAVAAANCAGVTAVGEAATSAAALAAFEEVAREGRLHVRIHAMLHDEPAVVERYLERGPVCDAFDGRLSIRALKVFADGALGSRGAALLEPYADEPDNAGLLRETASQIADAATRALARGYQLCVHAIGDRANRTALDGYERALATVPPGDYRLRIEHAQVVDPQDVPRFKALGVIASIQASHQLGDAAWAAARLGPARMNHAYAWRALLDTGIILANGSDAPVEPFDPRRTFAAAIAPAGGMMRDEALRSMTIWAAYANFAEHAIGSIAPGKDADFVIVDRDWMREPVDSIGGTQMVGTYSRGRRV